MTLIERLIDAGYPREEMFHHETDLYIYDNALTRKVIREYCTENGWPNIARQMDYTIVDCLVIKSFRDNITGKMMLDCFGQYYGTEA